MVDRKMPRIQEVVLGVIRQELPDVQVTSWVPDVDYREFPLLNVRRIGGIAVDPARLDRATIELTAYTESSLEDTEDLYLDAREVLWNMVQEQTVADDGYLHSFRETMGPTQFDSIFDDTWLVRGIIQLGVRPRRN